MNPVDIILPIFMLAGAVWIFFMLAAMFSIMALAPKGQKVRTYNQLSMWNFGQIRADLGPTVEPHLRMMRRGGIAFLIFFALVVAISIIAVVTNSANPGTP